MLQKELLQRHLLSFVRLTLQTKVPMGAITSSMLQNSKCNLILVLDILLLTRVGSLSKKKKQKGKILHASLLSYFPCFKSCFSTLCHNSTDTICYKNNNFGFSISFPTFWGKKGKLLFTVTIHLSPFTRHYSLVLFTVTVHSEILPI